MSDLDVVLSALPRIYAACRARGVVDGVDGGVVNEHQARILGQLDATDPTMVTELAEFLGVTPSTMSLNLKRLREAGFVDSVRDPDDHRVMNVRLTEVGSRIKQSSSELDDVRVHAMLQALGPEERASALRGLTLLAKAADKLPARGDSSTVALSSRA